MADASAIERGETRPDGLPKGKPFEPGNQAASGPRPESKYVAQLRAAIQEQETPAEVCKVVAAMKADALSGKKSAPAAAKVYLGAVGLKLDGGAETKVDLSDAPPEVMDYLRRKIPN